MGWPEIIRIEVKTTTQEYVPLPARELESLSSSAENEVGILATLFWCGDREVDGRWLIADAENTFRRNTAQVAAVSKARMQQAHRGEPWLTELKQHVSDMWPPFLHAFFHDAMLGHEALCKTLQENHEYGTITARLSSERVLETDHRDSIQKLIDHYGESQAGHLFQDLFGYLVGQAGYKNVLLNAVGVPDVTLSGFHEQEFESSDVDLGRFSVMEARQLLLHCEQAGDDLLANRIRSILAESQITVPSEKSEPD